MGYAISLIYDYAQKAKVMRKKNISLSDTILKEKQIAAVLLCLLAISFIDFFPNPVTNSSFWNPLTNQGNDLGWEEDEIELIEWIKKNTDKSSRILFESSGDATNFKISRGHNMLNLALATDRYFATGFTHPFFYEWHTESNYMEGILFGKSVKEYGFSEFYNYSINYNFKYIICWHPDSVKTFQKFALIPDQVESVANVTRYSIFVVKQARESYVISDSVLEIKDFLYSQDIISFIGKINSSEYKAKLKISFHNYPNWNVYVNGKKVAKLENDLGLIEFEILTDPLTDFLVEIKWEITAVEITANVISIIGVVLIGLMLVYSKKSEELLNQLILKDVGKTD